MDSGTLRSGCLGKSPYGANALLCLQLGLNTDQTIIVGEDDGLDSPNTVILKHEEAARAASGGDYPRNSSPPLNMATYSKAQLPSVPGE